MKLRKFLVAAFVLLSAGNAVAQQIPQLPVDKDVKIGKLDNGLTYYIRHNSFPEHVASFYIAQKVGSINEEEDQRGLAHLLEHLAFNGSDHFPGNSLQEYLQSIGVEYGRNLNAATGVEQTVYYFTDVPTTRITAVDSCMLILKDWSHGITLTQEAINSERDVVHNEYRMMMVGQQRMIERSLPALYPGSKYGVRMPIGLMSVIDGCAPETLRAYYRKWYRPDNQAVIVVGDVDVNHIEEQIKTLFKDVKVPADAAKVIPEAVPDNNEAIIVVDKDKEQQIDLALMFMKHDAFPDSLKNTVAYFANKYMSTLTAMMLNDRFTEKAQEPDCPFLQAMGGDGDYLFASTKQAFSLQTLAKQGQMKEALAATLRETKRARDFGFTGTEYSRAKENFMSSMEKIYTNRDKMKNEQFTTQYVDHFISNEPIPSVENEYQLYQQLSAMIPVEVINQYVKELISETDTNFVALVMMKEVDGATYPTTDELAAMVKGVRAEQLTAYVDNVKQEPLMAQLPNAGKIKSTKENTLLGYKELTLSNGAKVVLKKTDFKDDEIQFYAQGKGGIYAYDLKKDLQELRLFNELSSTTGLGNFSSTELDKALAGKKASVRRWADKYSHGLQGNTTPKDMETLMQLIHLNLTAINKDQKAFETLRNLISSYLDNQSKDANMVYRDSINSTLFNGDKLYILPKSAEINSINYDRMVEILQQMFYGRAKDMTFYFVGNIDEATILPLIEQYIASLPIDKKAVKLVNKQSDYATGEKVNIFDKEMENPQSQAQEYWQYECPNSLRNNVIRDIASRMLEMDYNRVIREQMSAAYSVGASSSSSPKVDGKTMVNYITAVAMLNPEKAEAAVAYFDKGFKGVIDNPSTEDLQKVKEILLKQADVNAKTNNYWLDIISDYMEKGIDFHTDYKSAISSVDGNAVSDFLKNTVLKGNGHFKIVMNGVK